MKQNLVYHISKYKGIYTALLFSLFSFLALFAILPLLLSSFFGGIIEMIGSVFVGSTKYKDQAIITIEILSTLIVICSVFLFRFLKYNDPTKKNGILIFIVFYLLNQSLGNYLYWWYDCNFCGYKDGQVFFRVFELKPILMTSVIFLLQGIAVDIYLIKFRKGVQIKQGNIKHQIDTMKVKELILLHQELSITELNQIIDNPGWTIEAKEAARQILLTK